MKSRVLPFTVACSIGENKINVYVLIDRKNSSVHLHLYGKMFGHKRIPVQVKNLLLEFTERNETALITKILTEYFSDQSVKINKIEKANSEEEFKGDSEPRKVIIRSTSLK